MTIFLAKTKETEHVQAIYSLYQYYTEDSQLSKEG